MTVEAPARGTAITPGAPRRWSWTALLIAAVLAVGIVLRFWTRSDLWLDEALSVNIARLPLSDLHTALRHDGAPPLYYFLLHFWIRAFGVGNLATRSLSGVISLATLPLAWFAGRRLGGRTVAWIAVVVLAASPYAAVYATSTRMYALVILLVFGAYLAGLRALEEPSPVRLAVVAVLVALLVYTQYWCFYLVGVAALLLLIQAMRAGPGDTRRAAVRTLVAVAVGLATFIAWIPTFLYQARHTGTPWANAQVPWSSTAQAVLRFAGSDQNGETFILLFALLTLVVFAVFGRGVNDRVIELDLRTQPRVRREAVLAFGTLIVGASVSFVAGSAFDARYASVMFPFYVLLVAVGVSLFLDRRVRAGVLVVVVAIGVVGGVRNVTTNRSQAAQSTNIIAAEARPGDVVAYCPDQLGPSASRLLGGVPGLVQLTFPDGAAPDRVDWVDYVKRIQAASPPAFADRLVARAGPHTIWYVYALGYTNVIGKCEAIAAALNHARPNASERVVQDELADEHMGLTVYRP